jgi:ubiquinone/menaquinone biosynthesis C-methylase UbiE
MKPVDYDHVASTYDRRYDRTRYEDIQTSLSSCIGAEPGTTAAAEVGCGTGHWLAYLSQHGVGQLTGLDRSRRMLERARRAAPAARLVRGAAERLPWVDACVDRLFCVNALHHFSDPQAFIAECRRVLRPNGGLLTIGLDPHAGTDQWWVYDAFPAALHADRRRFQPASAVREWLTAAGFRRCATVVAQHIVAAIPYNKALEIGLTDRGAASQLMVISDAEYEAGMSRLRAERPLLQSDVTLYATTAWL